jgi:hypothetical protein
MNRITPIVDVPMVRVLDGDGNEVVRGWYALHINRTTGPIGDILHDRDTEHWVIYDGHLDWNMLRGIEIRVVNPITETIEVIKEGDHDQE